MIKFKLGIRSKFRMKGVNPDLIRVAHRAIQITIIDFGIPKHGGVRNSKIQLFLFKKGVSKADGVINKSEHQSGNALDFYALDPFTGKASWDELYLTLIAAAFLQAASELGVKLQWGGFWKSYKDMPHLQLL